VILSELSTKFLFRGDRCRKALIFRLLCVQLEFRYPKFNFTCYREFYQIKTVRRRWVMGESMSFRICTEAMAINPMRHPYSLIRPPAYSIEQVNAANEHAFRDFLNFHAEETLTMRCSYFSHGPLVGEHSYSGNFKLLIDDQGCAVGAFVVLKCGWLLMSSTVKEPLFDLVAQSCQQEGLPILAVMAEQTLATGLWDHLKSVGLVTFAVGREMSINQTVCTSADDKLPF
jgi:hypothetical protein